MIDAVRLYPVLEKDEKKIQIEKKNRKQAVTSSESGDIFLSDVLNVRPPPYTEVQIGSTSGKDSRAGAVQGQVVSRVRW